MTDDPMLTHLRSLGVPFEVIPCDPALADTAQFCAAYGYAMEDSANTIVVVGKSNPPTYAACVVLATHRLNVNREVRSRLGTRKASFASPEETRAITGHEIGGVTVFGLPDGLPVLVDAAVMGRDRIVLGGGSRSWKVLAPPSILLTIGHAEIVEGLATPAPPRPEGLEAPDPGATTALSATLEPPASGAPDAPGVAAPSGD
jgi:prolyl-tRNA editing enzyme YbaK/EbsC (Cys-tRNA(Pro) deacylase)